MMVNIFQLYAFPFFVFLLPVFTFLWAAGFRRCFREESAGPKTSAISDLLSDLVAARSCEKSAPKWRMRSYSTEQKQSVQCVACNVLYVVLLPNPKLPESIHFYVNLVRFHPQLKFLTQLCVCQIAANAKKKEIDEAKEICSGQASCLHILSLFFKIIRYLSSSSSSEWPMQLEFLHQTTS